MKVCVLQPDYTGSSVHYQHFDPRRNLSHLLPDCDVDHLFLRKATVYKQLREASGRNYDIYVNLCEGYLDWDIPSLDVIWSMDLLKLPYTGPSARLYDPSKELMKYVAYTQGVRFPPFVEARVESDCDTAIEVLRFPMFVKPAHAGDSLGIDSASYVTCERELRAKTAAILAEYGRAMIEEYVDGREFTVLVAANAANRFEPIVFAPIEFRFPGSARFKTYTLKVEEHHPDCNVAVDDAELNGWLRCAAREIFTGFEGEGYARLDFRVNQAGELFFLDINFACSVFYPPGYEGSADYILNLEPEGASRFLRAIIDEGIERRRRNRMRYERRGNSRFGFGIYATEDIARGEVVLSREERAHRLATFRHVQRNWPMSQRETFRHYAIPLNGEVAVMWSDDPAHWEPQNHSCDPNTTFAGLDVVATRDIHRGEELTFDYALIYGPQLPTFRCHCGSASCRGNVAGAPGNSLGRFDSE